MTGSPHRAKMPGAPAPQPMPETANEMIAAKDKTKRKKKGRASTILAGKMTQSIMKFGKTHLGE